LIDTDMQCNNTAYTAHGFLNHIRHNAHLGFTPTSAYEFNYLMFVVLCHTWCADIVPSHHIQPFHGEGPHPFLRTGLPAACRKI